MFNHVWAAVGDMLLPFFFAQEALLSILLYLLSTTDRMRVEEAVAHWLPPPADLITHTEQIGNVPSWVFMPKVSLYVSRSLMLPHKTITCLLTSRYFNKGSWLLSGLMFSWCKVPSLRPPLNGRWGGLRQERRYKLFTRNRVMLMGWHDTRLGHVATSLAFSGAQWQVTRLP